MRPVAEGLWYLAAREPMLSANSRLNSARSRALENTSSASTAKVASWLVRRAGPDDQAPHLAQGSRGKGKHPDRGKAVPQFAGARVQGSHGFRRNHVGRGRRLHQAFGHDALVALLHLLHQPEFGQLVQVVGDFLARDVHSLGKHARGRRLAQLPQEGASHGVKRGGCGPRVFQHGKV